MGLGGLARLGACLRLWGAACAVWRGAVGRLWGLWLRGLGAGPWVGLWCWGARCVLDLCTAWVWRLLCASLWGTPLGGGLGRGAWVA